MRNTILVVYPNLMLPDLDPGKYTIDLKWGTDRNLTSSFVIEIERYWWQNIWLQVLVSNDFEWCSFYCR